MIRFCINCKCFDKELKCCKLYGSSTTGIVCGFHDYAPGVLNAEHEFNLKMEGTEMESYVLILESLISELTGVLMGDVKKPDHIKKLCDSAKQFVDKEQGVYFSKIANNCERMMRWEAEKGELIRRCRTRINCNINYLASKYMEIVINM